MIESTLSEITHTHTHTHIYIYTYIYIYIYVYVYVWVYMCYFTWRNNLVIALVSVFSGLLVINGLFNAKFHIDTIQPIGRENKGVHSFPKGNYPKVNVIARMEFELVNSDVALLLLNHSTTGTHFLQIYSVNFTYRKISFLKISWENAGNGESCGF